MTYQETYAGSSQKYTSAWPKNQNSVRASSGSVPPSSPTDHGISIPSISAATPREQICHITIVMSEASAISGVRSPGCSRRHRP